MYCAHNQKKQMHLCYGTTSPYSSLFGIALCEHVRIGWGGGSGGGGGVGERGVKSDGGSVSCTLNNRHRDRKDDSSPN